MQARENDAIIDELKLPPPQPQPLTQDALHIHDLLTSEHITSWPGTKSQLFLVPFTKEAKEPFTSGVDYMPLRAPQEEAEAKLWPHNAFVDWCWGARLLTAFGSDEICTFAETSLTMALVNKTRKR